MVWGKVIPRWRERDGVGVVPGHVPPPRGRKTVLLISRSRGEASRQSIHPADRAYPPRPPQGVPPYSEALVNPPCKVTLQGTRIDLIECDAPMLFDDSSHFAEDGVMLIVGKLLDILLDERYSF